MTKKIAAVIVTFNRLDKLKFTLEKTLANAFDSVVVVNNCSNDGTQEWLDTLTDARLCILHEPENIGGAGGFNHGFKYVAEQLPDIDWLVCFDDDAYPQTDAVKQFQQADVDDDIGSCAAAVYLPSGEISEMNRPSRNPFWHLKSLVLTSLKGRGGFHVSDESYLSSQQEEIDASSFVGCFIRVDLIRQKKIGLPRKELFIYADDIIYILELRKAGFRHLFIPKIKFNHDCETLAGQKDVYRPLWKIYFTYRNRIEMYRVAAGIFFPLICMIKIPQWFMAYRFYKESEIPIFKMLFKRAVSDGLKRNYKMNLSSVLSLIEQEGK